MNRYTKYDFLLFIDEISSEFPEVKEYALELVKNRRPVKLIEAIERITSEPGGATYIEIARQTGFSVMETRNIITEMKQVKSIHIHGWKHEPGCVRKQAIYAFGPGTDAPYPRREPGERPVYRRITAKRDMAAAWL